MLIAISAILTVGVYGLVAGIVKLDDAGLYLSQRANAGARALGRAILAAAPWLMKFLSIAGTAAMFLVGGGILVHAIGPLHHLVLDLANASGVAWLVEALGNALVGVLAGIAVLLAVKGIGRLRPARPATH